MPPNTEPVCDNCRLRKTRCDRAVPCSTCVGCDFPCQYSHNLQRRGPKGGKGRRLAIIKQGLANDAAARGASTQRTTQILSAAISPRRLQVDNVAALPPSPSPLTSPDFGNNLQAILSNHVDIFMSHLFPVMPVVDEVRLRTDCGATETLSPSRLALLLALAAVTRIQLHLDKSGDGIVYEEIGEHMNNAYDSSTSGLQFLAAAEEARQKINVADSMSEDAILTSFFLFVCYGNQEKHKQAWFYLNQSISMAILLELDNETADSVAGLTDKDIDRRRRIFWLLFISERFFFEAVSLMRFTNDFLEHMPCNGECLFCCVAQYPSREYSIRTTPSS